MHRRSHQLDRRSFLKLALQAGAVAATPQIVSAAVLGKGGGVPGKGPTPEK